jgi:hypothetical protein
MTVLEVADELTDEVMKELDGRSLFNGIDDDIVDEIREALYDILARRVS